MSRRDIFLACGALPLLVFLACSDDAAPGSSSGGADQDAAASGEGGAGSGGEGGPSPIDPGDGSCDPTKPFVTIIPVRGLNTGANESGPTLSQDEKTIIFARNVDSGPLFDFYIATRDDRMAAFGAPQPLTDLNEADADERMPSLSGDGLSLYYQRAKDAPYEIYVSKRANVSASFGAGAPVPSLNSAVVEASPRIRGDGSVLYFVRDTVDETNAEIWAANATGAAFDGLQALAELSSANSEWAPVPTKDGLGLFFGRGPVGGDRHIWLAKRAAASGPFTQIARVDELASTDQDDPGWISEDGCRLYFTSYRAEGGGGAEDIWVAIRGK